MKNIISESTLKLVKGMYKSKSKEEIIKFLKLMGYKDV